MSRGRRVSKKKIQPDLLHKSRLVTRLINNLMIGGNKSKAQKIVYGAISALDADQKEAVNKFEVAVKNIIPQVEVRSRRVGGANYQVPVPVKHDRGEALAIRWIIEAARKKSGKPMVDQLAQELKDALNETGEARRKKEIVLKMAEANRAFSHFRW